MAEKKKKEKKQEETPAGKSDIQCAIQSLEYAQKYLIDARYFLEKEKDYEEHHKNLKSILDLVTKSIGEIHN